MSEAAEKYPDLTSELERLKFELEEANMTIEAIRTGQVDALLVESEKGPQLYTLNSADQAYRFFIEQMKEGAITLDRSGLVLFTNGQFANLVGLPVSAVLGRKLTEFVELTERYRCETMQQNAWISPGKAEFCIVRADQCVPVQFSMTPIDWAEELSLSVLITDLSEQKATENTLKENNEKLLQANRDLEASNHDLQQFASVASHDLQEPVRKIQIFSMMLREHEKQLSADGIQRLNKVISSADRMKMLIVDILNYSALSSNDNRFVKVPLDALVGSLLEDFELVIRHNEADITIGPLPEILGNPGQIRQVFQNLLSNALKFVRPGVRPRVAIRSSRVSAVGTQVKTDASGSCWQFSVEDNGIGFEKQYADNIFSLFERLNGKDKFEGTGIGLAIAKKIIEKHGGSISARSNPGEGSVFTFLIPVNPVNKL